MFQYTENDKSGKFSPLKFIIQLYIQNEILVTKAVFAKIS